MDVLSASYNADCIRFYESDGGSPPSFTIRNITTLADGAYDVYAKDMDADGDLDVVRGCGVLVWGACVGCWCGLLGSAAGCCLVAKGSALTVCRVYVLAACPSKQLSASHVDDTIAW
jgi:hypothetical protein